MTDTLHSIPLPYDADGRRWFRALCHEPWSAWLDSGRPGPAAGRYDIFVARPRATLVHWDGVSVIHDEDGSLRLPGDPLEHLRGLLGSSGGRHPGEVGAPVQGRRESFPGGLAVAVQATDTLNGHPHLPRMTASRTSGQPGRHPGFRELPFYGGAVGYFAYDLGRGRLGVPGVEPDLPVMAVGVYDWAVVADHEFGSTVLVGEGAGRRLAEELERRWEAAEAQSPGAFRLTGPLRGAPDAAGYAEAFERVQRYIRAGDCYQINLARRLSAPYQGDSMDGYLALRDRAPAPFSAWLRLPFADVLSLSPERFLRLDADRTVVTEPIKGTRPRSDDPVADAAAAEALATSAKDRAENVMIVDLLRNDLGKVCETGTVAVPSLFEPRRFANVHHLVSTVTGKLRKDRDALHLLGACLPGGSITGAPKRRAVEIIQELEPGPRGVYCGSIGYLGFDGRVDTNIAIRTAVCAGGEITYWAGGGIVADSDMAAELQETADKAVAFLGLEIASLRS